MTFFDLVDWNAVAAAPPPSMLQVSELSRVRMVSRHLVLEYRNGVVDQVVQQQLHRGVIGAHVRPSSGAISVHVKLRVRQRGAKPPQRLVDHRREAQLLERYTSVTSVIRAYRR